VAIVALRPAQEPCRDAAQRLAGIWDAPARERLRAVFAAAGKPTSFDAVARRLDRWAGDWIAQHTEACEATAVRREQSEALLDRRMECLASRREELATLLEVAARGDASTVDNVLPALGWMTPLDGCADVAGLAAAVPPPTDPALRQRVAELRHGLAQARAFSAIGKWKDQLDLVARLAAEVRAVPYAPIQAEILLFHAECKQGAGDGPGAQALFEETLRAAARARLDGILAWTHMYLVRNIGLTQGRPDDALALRPAAEAAILRAGDPPRLRGALQSTVGTVLLHRGDYRDAERALREAIAVLGRPGGEDLVGTALLDLGAAQQAQGRLVEARATFERTRRAFQPTATDDSPMIAYAIGAAANVELALGRHEEARAGAARALAILERAQGPDSPDVAEPLQTLAEVALAGGDPAAARPPLERALAIREATLGPDHPFVAVTLRALSELALREGDPDGALRLADRSLAIVEKRLGRAHPLAARAEIARARALVGTAPREALAAADRAVAIDEHASGPASLAVADGRIARADAHRRLASPARCVEDAARAEVIRAAAAPGAPAAAEARRLRASCRQRPGAPG
jgi:tetratricopeptide (TPR) repeat protein